jgi:rhamnulokinase
VAVVKHYLACDLGAESGRLILGTLSGNGAEEQRLELEELHRFANTPLKENGRLFWNIPNLVVELKEGLRKAATRKLPLRSISTDSWGVDYMLFEKGGELMSPTFHYRDARTETAVAKAFEKVPWPEIFAESGIQFMSINTLFQLVSENPSRLRSAEFLLGVADGFNFFLSGVAAVEVSMASTFQLYNPVQRGWSGQLIEKLGLPRRIFPRIVPSGTVLGNLRPELSEELGLQPFPVIATCSHDTGAAVAGVPASGPGWAYISSGTWSLIGVERNSPVLTEECRELNFTNEIGFGGSVRLLKNIIGLWLVQECRREWQREGQNFEYGELTRLAEEAQPFAALINPASPEFLAPENMATQIRKLCLRTGQAVPQTAGAVIRTVLESLALLYQEALKELEQITGEAIRILHVVGGGSRNSLLNQMTANACGIPVIAGPPEATAAGNILIQAIALGDIPSLPSAREIVRNSSQMKMFNPVDDSLWAAQRSRFARLLENRERK